MKEACRSTSDRGPQGPAPVFFCNTSCWKFAPQLLVSHGQPSHCTRPLDRADFECATGSARGCPFGGKLDCSKMPASSQNADRMLALGLARLRTSTHPHHPTVLDAESFGAAVRLSSHRIPRPSPHRHGRLCESFSCHLKSCKASWALRAWVPPAPRRAGQPRRQHWAVEPPASRALLPVRKGRSRRGLRCATVRQGRRLPTWAAPRRA
mmetsp:Transcript_653/g.2297  ORF Transcript_653/g.2297 Transcript_653/m.2297 type:complete len:209 (+) Transcript_653:180-806(+)